MSKRPKPGDVAIVSTWVAKKWHLATIRGDRNDEERLDHERELAHWAEMPAKLQKLRRAPGPAPQPKSDYRDQWNADSYCGGGNSKATYGEVKTYYWHVYAIGKVGGGESSICKTCLQKWRAAGKPTVVGWTDTEAAGEWELPFGWTELPASSHPRDVPSGTDPDTVLDKAGRSIGQTLTELRRWARGDRTVRLVRDYVTDTYAAHAVDTDGDDDWKYRGNLNYATQGAWRLMARGGY